MKKVRIGQVGEAIALAGGTSLILMCVIHAVVVLWFGVVGVIVGGVLIDVDLLLNWPKEKT